MWVTACLLHGVGRPGLPAPPGEYPTEADWANHLSTVFPDVRLKKFVEMRGADAGPWRMLCALPALWVGLLYEPQVRSSSRKVLGLTSAEVCGELLGEWVAVLSGGDFLGGLWPGGGFANVSSGSVCSY
jgi:hypothetical protein